MWIIAISVSVCLSVCLSVCMFVCLFLCLSACATQKPHVQILPHFLCALAVVLSLTAVQYVIYLLKVWYMTTCFYIIERIVQNQRRRLCFIQFARWRYQSDVSRFWSSSLGDGVCRLRLHLLYFLCVRIMVCFICRLIILRAHCTAI